ncbi:MAG: hypothetical protein QGG57_02490 [Candidatus Poseidoniia archaeon]|nr:hypothetical protein [Candidatus Poseidoniia archaeon]
MDSGSGGKSQAEEEEYRKWKAGDGHSAHPHDYLAEDSGRYSLRFAFGW